jgi:hypothetical protein
VPHRRERGRRERSTDRLYLDADACPVKPEAYRSPADTGSRRRGRNSFLNVPSTR